MTPCLGLLLAFAGSSLASTCGDFTVGQCSPDMDEQIDMYEQIPEAPMCQLLCTIQEGCNYFRHSMSSKQCELYHYRFLSSCNLIAGPDMPDIDDCSEPETPNCDSFISENCDYSTDKKLEKDSITDAHACQELLQTLGSIYSAVYFSFDSVAQHCVLYGSVERNCDILSGPVSPSIAECSGGSTTKAPTTTTKAPTTTANAATTTTKATTTPKATTTTKSADTTTTPVNH
jgi:hypothetical protein